MNKKQLCIIWLTLILLTSMLWFPGWWFDYIIEGYPVIRPESKEFWIRIFIPIVACALFLLYLVRSRKESKQEGPGERARGFSIRVIVKNTLILSIGLLLGLCIGAFLLVLKDNPADREINTSIKTPFKDNEFKNFCKKEGYREEVDNLLKWLREKGSRKVAIVYNADDAYSADVYKNFSQRLDHDENIKVVFSDNFKVGERSFYSRLKIIESIKPEAIVFLGTYEERLAFLENISQRSELAYWKQTLSKVKWIE